VRGFARAAVRRLPSFVRPRRHEVRADGSHRRPECAAVLPWHEGRPEAGDLIEPGCNSNYGKKKEAAYVYLTATLDAATWGAELALGEGPGRIYVVEPTGPIQDDPNLTDKKYPGNPTKSYRSRAALRVTGEVSDWQGHSPEELKAMKDNLERLRRLGVEAIED
jgi:Rifampin ADP-ribosyl transferase